MVRVEFYSGSVRDETPRALVISGQRLEVSRVVKREIRGSAHTEAAIQRRFVVQLSDGTLWTLTEAPDHLCGWESERTLPIN